MIALLKNDIIFAEQYTTKYVRRRRTTDNLVYFILFFFNFDCSCPDNIMACILADYGPLHDVTINIEHTLLEAYCMENGIRVLKVNTWQHVNIS